MTSPAPVPRTIDEITPAWLTLALGERNPGINVNAVDVVEVISGTATKVRLHVDHDGAPDIPRDLCLKAGFGDHAEMMAATGIYADEARFFRDLRDRIDVPAPRAWWTGIDSASNLGAVLMEDLGRAGVRFCRSTEPFSVDDADAALSVHVALHRAYFNDSWLVEAGWLPHSVSEPGPSAAYFRTLGPDVIAAELAKPQRGAVVPAELHDPERIVEAFWRWVATNDEGPIALLHGDAHVGNLYFDGDAPGYCDWQTIRYGRPTFDLAYFLGSALAIEDRRAAERDLLLSYRERLAATTEGVMSFDDLWHDYRRDMTYGFFAWLTNLDVFQPEAVNVATIERFAVAVLDLESEGAFR